MIASEKRARKYMRQAGLTDITAGKEGYKLVVADLKTHEIFGFRTWTHAISVLDFLRKEVKAV